MYLHVLHTQRLQNALVYATNFIKSETKSQKFAKLYIYSYFYTL